MKTVKKEKKGFSFSNIISVILLAALILMIAKPEAKAFVIQQFMKVGLFKPNIPNPQEIPTEEGADDAQQTSNVYFRDSRGRVITLHSLKGKIVFINFWATWCPPCIAEMPSIHKLYQQFKNRKDIVFLMVDVDNALDKSQKFMDKKKFDLPVYVPGSPLPDTFLSGSIPTTIILDKGGKMVMRHEGGADYSDPKVSAFIKKLIKN